MLLLVKLFPEITIKSRPVRRRFIRQLRKNLRSILRELDDSVSVTGEWDMIEVECARNDEVLAGLMIEKLTNTPGISAILLVEKFPLPDMEGILALCKTYFTEALKDKTFAVRCKRKGRHGFKSTDVEREVGGVLNQQTEAAGVKLVKPDVTVNLEIHDEELFLVSNKYVGLGGFPLGCQDSVLSLISGGFDSPVSSYLCTKRGLLTHYCFFNLGGRAHELAVKEVALFLWMKYHSSHRVKFVSVPFERVVEEILTNVENSQMGVVLKRMMLRAAEQVADKLQIKTLVTGESVAQVSSQTLPNLAVIDSVIDTMVLRPLSMTDKQEIIDKAREIGTEEFSKDIPEYCGVISVKPTTRARSERIDREESNFDFTVLDESIKNSNYQLITKLVEGVAQGSASVNVVSELSSGTTLIDIRHPAELELKPLEQSLIGEGVELLHIPFYKLRTNFDSLDLDKAYFLYCDKGMMSRLHAANLGDVGFENVGVFSPAD
jgi:thiamine biosynthesis protein ThiI